MTSTYTTKLCPHCKGKGYIYKKGATTIACRYCEAGERYKKENF